MLIFASFGGLFSVKASVVDCTSLLRLLSEGIEGQFPSERPWIVDFVSLESSTTDQFQRLAHKIKDNRLLSFQDQLVQLNGQASHMIKNGVIHFREKVPGGFKALAFAHARENLAEQGFFVELAQVHTHKSRELDRVAQAYRNAGKAQSEAKEAGQAEQVSYWAQEKSNRLEDMERLTAEADFYRHSLQMYDRYLAPNYFSETRDEDVREFFSALSASSQKNADPYVIQDNRLTPDESLLEILIRYRLATSEEEKLFYRLIGERVISLFPELEREVDQRLK